MTPYKNGIPKNHNLLGTTLHEVPRFITKKWVEVDEQSGNAEARYKSSKQIRFKTSMLRSDLCDFSDVVKATITVTGGSNTSRKNRSLAFKNNSSFTNYISKTNNVLIDNADDLNVVIPIYNLLEYSKNYRKKTGSLWNYYRDELSDDTNDNINPNKNVINSGSFKYKTSITGCTYDIDERITNSKGNLVNNPAYGANTSGKKEVKIAVPLKCLSNFWRALKVPLINCEVPLILTWSEECIITSIERRVLRNTQRDNSPTNATFQLTDTTSNISVVTLSTKDDNNFLEQLKSGFKRTIKWNKYRSEMTNQTKTNNLNYLIDPTFTKVNRLFVLSFEN